MYLNSVDVGTADVDGGVNKAAQKCPIAEACRERRLNQCRLLQRRLRGLHVHLQDRHQRQHRHQRAVQLRGHCIKGGVLGTKRYIF